MSSATLTPRRVERKQLADIDAQFEDEMNRIYCEHIGRMIEVGK